MGKGEFIFCLLLIKIVQVCQIDDYFFILGFSTTKGWSPKDTPRNVPIPFAFVPPSIVPPWNKKVDNYVELNSV